MGFFKKKKKVEEGFVQTFSATGSMVKITTKSGNDYLLSTDQNMLETLETLKHTKGYIYDNQGLAVKVSEIEAFRYIKVGGQDSEQPDEII
jgi:hypothetical protein